MHSLPDSSTAITSGWKNFSGIEDIQRVESLFDFLLECNKVGVHHQREIGCSLRAYAMFSADGSPQTIYLLI